jgi:hypothetical protein
MDKFDTLAFNVGAASQKTRSECDPAHAAYVGMDETEQKELRRAWLVAHVAGQLSVVKQLPRQQAVKAAEKVLETGKGADAKPENVRMIDRASSDFRYHVIRPDAASAKTQKKAVRTSAAEKAAWAAFVQAVGEERALIVAKALG